MGKPFLSVAVVLALATVVTGCGSSAPVKIATSKRMRHEVDRTALRLAPSLSAEFGAQIVDPGGSFGFCDRPQDDQSYGAVFGLRKKSWVHSNRS